MDSFFHLDIPSHCYPKEYPSSALLGCVNVVDCASNEEYFQKVEEFYFVFKTLLSNRHDHWPCFSFYEKQLIDSQENSKQIIWNIYHFSCASKFYLAEYFFVLWKNCMTKGSSRILKIWQRMFLNYCSTGDQVTKFSGTHCWFNNKRWKECTSKIT